MNLLLLIQQLLLFPSVSSVQCWFSLFSYCLQFLFFFLTIIPYFFVLIKIFIHLQFLLFLHRSYETVWDLFIPFTITHLSVQFSKNFSYPYIILIFILQHQLCTVHCMYCQLIWETKCMDMSKIFGYKRALLNHCSSSVNLLFIFFLPELKYNSVGINNQKEGKCCHPIKGFSFFQAVLRNKVGNEHPLT